MTRRGLGPDTSDKPAEDPTATRAAKGSAQEAIGKLIGDDAARLRGAAQKKAARAQGAGVKDHSAEQRKPRGADKNDPKTKDL